MLNEQSNYKTLIIIINNKHNNKFKLNNKTFIKPID